MICWISIEFCLDLDPDLDVNLDLRIPDSKFDIDTLCIPTLISILIPSWTDAQSIDSDLTLRELVVYHNYLPFRYLHIVGVLMFGTFMLLVAIVYLNLLVAIMTSGYTEVKKQDVDKVL